MAAGLAGWVQICGVAVDPAGAVTAARAAALAGTARLNPGLVVIGAKLLVFTGAVAVALAGYVFRRAARGADGAVLHFLRVQPDGSAGPLPLPGVWPAVHVADHRGVSARPGVVH